jgi:hypothetical protein
MANDVPTPIRAPPRLPLTATPFDSALPHWHHLTPQVQQPVVALLMRMLQQHLLAPRRSDAREVADESR